MGSMLDQRFFELIKRTDHKGSVLESYKAVYARSTMVLFSRKTRTPLAALTLKADDVGCLSMLTGRPAPAGASDPYFQGMLNMPDQTFTFTISNLSEGMINFNILHTPHRISVVDPGPSYGINVVNELHRNQSYTVTADQRNNRRMILTGKTTTIKDPETSIAKQVSVTVKQSEAAPNKPTGLYFHLSVVPDLSCKSLVDKFAEGTVWKVSAGFVRRVARLPGFVRPGAMPEATVVSSARYQATRPDAESLSRLGPHHRVFTEETRPGEEFSSINHEEACADDGLTIEADKHMAKRRMMRGECPTCGNRTHRMGMFGKKTPLTVEGMCIHGRCLLCRPLEGDQSRPEPNLLIAERGPIGQGQGILQGRDIILNDDDDVSSSGITLDAVLITHPPGRGWRRPELDDLVEEDGFEDPPPPLRPKRPEPSVCGDAVLDSGRRLNQVSGRPNQDMQFSQGDWMESIGKDLDASMTLTDLSINEKPSRDHRGWQLSRPASPPLTHIAGILEGINSTEAHFVSPIDVGTTQAGALNYGEQVNVQSSYTGHDYAYEHSSEPAVLCMSIWEGMKFLALSSSVEEELAAEVTEWMENEGRALIASLNAIFKTEICVIDQESEADTIVCTCGHQCLNHANVRNELRKCPICRSPITAFVRADGIMLE